MQQSLSLLSALPCWFKPAVINGLEKKLLSQRRAHVFQFNLFLLRPFPYFTFRIIMSFRKACHMPFRKLIPPLRGCLHETGATFAPERVHSGSLSWLYICLHDTTTKCHAGASHPGVSSPRFLLSC